MALKILILFVFAFFQIILSKNTTLDDSKDKEVYNKIKQIDSETGSVAIPDSHNLFTSKYNTSDVRQESRDTSIMAQEGMVLHSSKDNITLDNNMNSTKLDQTMKVKNSKEPIMRIQKLNNSTELHNSKDAKVTSHSGALNKESNHTDVPKKPLILSYDNLFNIENAQLTKTGKKMSLETIKLEKSSPKENTNGVLSQYHTINGNNHPGMVMPVVITMLVVPIFALFGYLALKRGREAWKNRTYKRMDFLLDGMYID